MGTVKTLKAKLIVILIVFMILFSNFGFTLSAIATSDEFEVINRGFFRKDEIKFDAYFEDEDGNKVTELTKNVNENIKLVLEILPQVEGFLQDGKIRAVSADGSDLGFKFSTVSQNLLTTTKSEVNILDAIKDIENVEEEPKTEVEKTDDEKGEEPKTDSDTNTVNVDSSIQSILDKVSDKVQQADSDVVKTNPLASILDVIGEEILVDENVIVEDEDEKEETFEDKIKDALLDITVESENEILLSNIIEDTKIVVDLEFVSGDKLDINNLLEEVKLQLSGTFINKNLKEVKIGKEEKVIVGWEYSKDIVVSSEFTKFSPFSVMDVSGTIVQNDITITRNINDEKYLPIKSTTIEVDVPKINDQSPIEINVIANKTLATNGEDVGETTFTRDNWSYDKESNKITIKTINKEGNTAVYSQGEDQYVIIYRFKDFIEEEKYNLSNKITVRTVEYSANTHTITKKIDETKEVIVKRDELLTSSIGTSSDKINKAKINANYNSDTTMYETEYKTQIRVNILTSDILEKVKIDVSKENFKSDLGLDFDADEVEIRSIKFNNTQLQEILANGGEIIIKNYNDEVLYVLNKTLLKDKNELFIKLDNAKDIIIELSGIKRNGTIDFELVKVIGKCNIDKKIFNQNITHVESIVDMAVKYLGMNEEIQLTPMAAKKEFGKSYTEATLSVNKEVFSTTKENGNIEFKIELNNNNVNGDLYVNPTFEIALPYHIKEIRLLNANIINGEEFRITDFGTYTNVDGTPRIKIELEGIQRQFNSSELTNGTNIIVNADIVVDEYTSSKKDQIKLYYCNEGVANYAVQTKWSVLRNYSDNILKETNGYDAKAIEFKGPNGLLAINAIKNYDGNDSIVRSIKQGEKTVTVPRNGNSKNATMELTLLNNTGNNCENTVLLGRVPFKGNKDVVTGEDLGTNIDTKVISGIIASEHNTNKSKIYYSINPNADTDLSKAGNEWVENSLGQSTKSFMIVVDGVVEPGAILRYTYDFEIPGNLGYEVKILGSFAAFYNNKTETALLKGTAIADSVGIVTEVGAKYEATMSVDIGDGKDVGEMRYITYTVKVTNTGSMDLKNVSVIANRPRNAYFCQKELNKDEGNNGLLVKHNLEEIVSSIPEIKVGETKEVQYYVKSSEIPETLDDYTVGIKDVQYDHEKSMYYTINDKNEREYIKELPKTFYIENSAKVSVEGSQKTISTNVVKNRLVPSNFDIEITPYKSTGLIYDYVSGDVFQYVARIKNISGIEIDNVKLEAKFPDAIEFKGINKLTEQYEYEYDKENNSAVFDLGTLPVNESARFFIDCDINNMKNIGSLNTEAYFNVTSAKPDEKSTPIKVKFIGPELRVVQELNKENNIVKEMEDFEYIISLKNSGEYRSKGIDLEVEIPDILEVNSVTASGSKPISSNVEGNKLKIYVSTVDPNENLSIIVRFNSEPLNDDEESRELKLPTIVSERYIGNIETEEFKLWMIDDPNRELTEQEKEDKLNEELFKPSDEYVTPDDEESPIVDKDTNVQPELDNNENNNDYSDPNPSTGNGSQSNTNNTDDSNNSNNFDNTDNNETNNSDNKTENDDDKAIEEKVDITGLVWKDENKDGIRDDVENGIRGVSVSLYKGNSQIKTCITDSQGGYRFTDVDKGIYVVVFEYDYSLYAATTYRKNGVPEDRNSDVIEASDGKAVTDNITVTNNEEIDLGLLYKDEYDMSIEKYIVKSIVKTNDKEKVTEYDNKMLEKLEIRSKELKDTEITLEYKIVISNIGSVDGIVDIVKDYIPASLTFDEKNNNGWYLDSEGVLCNASLQNEELKPGETRELKLVLNKVMTEDNTGTIVNKVELESNSNNNLIDEKVENNVATQELLVTVSTGRTVQVVLLIACITGFAVLFNFTNIKSILTGKRIYK